MIKTEEQRRWWFATHPEYSRSQRGIKGRKADWSEMEDDDYEIDLTDIDDYVDDYEIDPTDIEQYSDEDEIDLTDIEEYLDEYEIDPRDIDDYVNNALKYETDESVRDLLESIKSIFGTEAELLKEQQNLNAWEGILQDERGTAAEDWVIPASSGDLLISELPTLEELSRWPVEMVNQLFAYIDTLIQSNPVLMDPNALEKHHMLVRQFATYFMECGLTLEEYTVIITAGKHRGKPGGLHTGKGRGGDWNSEWAEFIREWPKADNSVEHQERIKAKLEDMKKRYGIK
jgi:hypothetical protein